MGGSTPRNRLTPVARRLRKNATNAERLLWRALNGRQLEGFRFRRQVPVLDYVVDFACYEARLIVEVDGATHSTDAERARDALRDAALTRAGNHVLRVQNADVYDNREGVVETILAKLAELRSRAPHPNPPPQGGRGFANPEL